ncbi:MAG: hypothetical protein HY808_08790 [Nitrospirae bacterium]|nr:hypothetical protein [Nitrospirota bacterium]
MPATIVCLTFFAFLFSAFSVASAVSVVPNKAVLIGTVREYSVGSSSLYGMGPEQTIYKLTIMVEASENIEDVTNFLKGKEGQTLTFFTKINPSVEVYGKRIKAHVFYSGDERGGSFWIKNNIEVLK